MLNDTLHVVPVEEYAFPGIRTLLDPISKDEISVAFLSSCTITLDVHSDELAYRRTKYVGTDRCKLLIVKNDPSCANIPLLPKPSIDGTIQSLYRNGIIIAAI